MQPSTEVLRPSTPRHEENGSYLDHDSMINVLFWVQSYGSEDIASRLRDSSSPQ
jgi:hypothetical protein